MNADGLLTTTMDRYENVVMTSAWGEQGLFYNPDNKLARGTYFLTVKDYDSENDTASELDRDGVYRVNFALRPDTYLSLFGDRPPRPAAGDLCETGYDYSRLDTLLPHPTYAWASWVCVLSPTEATFDALSALVDEAYELAQERFERQFTV